MLHSRTVRSSEHDARYLPLLLKSRQVTGLLWPCRQRVVTEDTGGGGRRSGTTAQRGKGDTGTGGTPASRGTPALTPAGQRHRGRHRRNTGIEGDIDTEEHTGISTEEAPALGTCSTLRAATSSRCVKLCCCGFSLRALAAGFAFRGSSGLACPFALGPAGAVGSLGPIQPRSAPRCPAPHRPNGTHRPAERWGSPAERSVAARLPAAGRRGRGR